MAIVLLGVCLAAPSERPRVRRQVSVPSQPQPSSGSSMLGFLSDLGPQLNTAKTFSSLFSSSSSSAQPGSSAAQPASSVASAGQLVSSLNDLMRGTQERSAKTAADMQQMSVNQVNQMNQATEQSVAAASNAQSGIQAALTEIGSGLQRIASNNPSLLPDVKNLYQSVSTKLSQASNSVGVAANPQQAQAQAQITDALKQSGLQGPA